MAWRVAASSCSNLANCLITGGSSGWCPSARERMLLMVFLFLLIAGVRAQVVRNVACPALVGAPAPDFLFQPQRVQLAGYRKAPDTPQTPFCLCELVALFGRWFLWLAVDLVVRPCGGSLFAVSCCENVFALLGWLHHFHRHRGNIKQIVVRWPDLDDCL